MPTEGALLQKKWNYSGLLVREVKNWLPTGVFRPISNGQVWTVLPFHIASYAKMSSVTFTQVLDCGIIFDATKMESATCTCCSHDALQSYFYDNTKLLQIFS